MAIEAADLETIKGLITESIGPAVNNMFTARLSTVEKKIEKQLKETTEGFSKALDEKLAGFKPGQDPPDDKGGKSSKKDVEVETLRKQFADLQAQLMTSQQQAEAEREKNRQIQLSQTVTEKLERLGAIHGVAAKMALGSLTAFGRVGWGTDDDTFGPDKLVFRGDDGSITELDVGLKQWLKSDEAKIFQAPTNVRGSGSRPGGLDPRGAGGGRPTLDHQKAIIEQALDNALG